MIDSVSWADVANAERFERIGIAADAESASRIREEFAGWLKQYFDLDPIRSSDLVLAINEALANSAEFAYLTTDRPGTMDLRAHYEPTDARLTVTIADQGVWRMPVSNPATRARGRGIPLMKALSDRVDIETSTAGTQVCLQWDGVSR
jgi:anti-sigma regulatory factor (Ser/Thr protein kinase)